MRRWHYWNANGSAVAVVAVVNPANPKNTEDSPRWFDWAVYIGGTEGIATRERETVNFVAESGCKLSREQACAFFPQFASIKYRH